MKKILISVIVLVCLIFVLSLTFFNKNQEEFEEIGQNNQELNLDYLAWLDNQKKLYQLNTQETNLILKEINEKWPDKGERLKILSLLRLDTPYQLGCLGEESGRDQEPIFRLDLTDCTVFVLTNVALLNSKSLAEARELMKFINYQPGQEISFENRLHFTTDRNLNSPFFKDVTEELASKDKIISKKVILNQVKKDGKRLIDINWQKEIIIKYIPSTYLNEDFLKSLPKQLGIAFVKDENFEIGLDVSHEGFLFDGVQLFHASSSQGKVVVEDFLDFYFDQNKKNVKYDGIILFDVILKE